MSRPELTMLAAGAFTGALLGSYLTAAWLMRNLPSLTELVAAEHRSRWTNG